MYVPATALPQYKTNLDQVAYLMADISNVDNTTIKDLYERLESLSCMNPICFLILTSLLTSSL